VLEGDTTLTTQLHGILCCYNPLNTSVWGAVCKNVDLWWPITVVEGGRVRKYKIRRPQMLTFRGHPGCWQIYPPPLFLCTIPNVVFPVDPPSAVACSILDADPFALLALRPLPAGVDGARHCSSVALVHFFLTKGGAFPSPKVEATGAAPEILRRVMARWIISDGVLAGLILVVTLCTFRSGRIHGSGVVDQFRLALGRYRVKSR